LVLHSKLFKRNHGIGTLSIKKIVNAYSREDGEIELLYSNIVIVCLIILIKIISIIRENDMAEKHFLWKNLI